MANDWGVGTYLTAQWAQFVNGLTQLRGGGRIQFRQGATPPNQAAGGNWNIVPPGLNEIFKLGGRPPLSRQDWSTYYNIQAGGGGQLDPGKLSEINRILQIQNRLANTTTPDWAQSFGQILTALDNVQDLLSTLAVVGRLVLAPALALFPGAGIPLFAMALAADVLRVLTLLGLISTPLYALICRTPGEALAGGVPALLFGRGAKNKIGALGALNPFGRGPKAGMKGAYGAWRGGKPNLYNLIEAIQVTGDLFGWGMSFGGMVGMVVDGSFGVQQQLGGEAARLRTPLDPRAYHRLWAAELAAFEPAALDDYRLAAGVLARGGLLLRPDAPLTQEDRIALLAACYAALDVLKPIFWTDACSQAIEIAEADVFSPPVYGLTDTLAGIHGDVDSADVARARWPSRGAPARLTGADYATAVHEAAAAYHAGLRSADPDSPLAWLEGALTARITERLAIAVYRSETAQRWELTDEWAIAECLAERKFILRVTEERPNLEAFYAAYVAQRRQTGRSMLGERELRELARAAGVTLIPLLPADAPYPPALAGAARS
ncbi:MAG: hypothetical protein ACREVS_08090 [Burkholderiales bacterium]